MTSRSPRDTATLQAFAGMEFPLPNGRTATARALGWKEFVHWYRELTRAQDGDAKAQNRLLDEFPGVVGLEEQLVDVSIPEYFELLNLFFFRRRPINPDPPPTNETTTGPGPAPA